MKSNNELINDFHLTREKYDKETREFCNTIENEFDSEILLQIIAKYIYLTYRNL